MMLEGPVSTAENTTETLDAKMRFLWSVQTIVLMKSNISAFCLVWHAGRRTTVNSAQDLAVSTSCVTLIDARLMLWTSGRSSVQSTTASRSGAGITSGSPTLKWTVSLVCDWGLCVKNTEKKKWMDDNYFMDQEAQNVSPLLCESPIYNLPRGCIFLCIHLCKRETDGLYSFYKDIISPKNKQYFPWIITTSQGFFGIEGPRKETTVFRVRNALKYRRAE